MLRGKRREIVKQLESSSRAGMGPGPGSQILQLEEIPGLHMLVFTLECNLESPGELCKILMPRPHPRAIKSDSLWAGAKHRTF